MKKYDPRVLVVVLGSVSFSVGCSGSSTEDRGSPPVKSDELATCSASPAMQAAPTSVDAFYAAYEGAWLGCPDHELPNDFGPRPLGEVGIELSRDGTYAVLLRDADGRLERGSGVDYTGSWYPSNTDGMIESSYMMVVPDGGGGMFFYRPTFTEDPRQLRIDEGLVLFHWSRYVLGDPP
jgi:hypothetical protein